MLTIFVLIAFVFSASDTALGAVIDAGVLMPAMLVGVWLACMRMAGRASDGLYPLDQLRLHHLCGRSSGWWGETGNQVASRRANSGVAAPPSAVISIEGRNLLSTARSKDPAPSCTSQDFCLRPPGAPVEMMAAGNFPTLGFRHPALWSG